MAQKFCLECGKPLVEGKKFCGECGAQVEEDAPDAEAPQVAAQESVPPETTARSEASPAGTPRGQKQSDSRSKWLIAAGVVVLLAEA